MLLLTVLRQWQPGSGGCCTINDLPVTYSDYAVMDVERWPVTAVDTAKDTSV